VPHRQARAQLEQRLPGPVGELVEDRPARGIRKGLEDVSHAPDNRQVAACLSMGLVMVRDPFSMA
jgi:hypothetical protein